VYAFIFGNTLLKIVTILSVAVLLASLISNYVFNFLYGEGYKLASVLNEILYLFLGIPIIIIAIGYVPLSVYILFASPDDNDWLLPILIGIMITMQIASFVYILTNRSKEKNRNIIQFVKYLFDFKARAEEQRKFREQTEEIDNFYSTMEKVKDKVDTKMSESVAVYDSLDWKKGSGIKQEERTETICWNCKKTNKEDSILCTNCNALLKRE